jgi:hypothetical protein
MVFCQPVTSKPLEKAANEKPDWYKPFRCYSFCSELPRSSVWNIRIGF